MSMRDVAAQIASLMIGIAMGLFLWTLWTIWLLIT
jgi:hypothetical protein